MKAFSDTANVDIDGMIKKSENREKDAETSWKGIV